MSVSQSCLSGVRHIGLRYVTDTSEGIVRKKGRNGFAYFLPDGTRLKEAEELDRIRKLAIPPAYHDVWICPDSRGHLQAVGIDAAGRKQYRYHSKFRESRDETKYHRLATFGQHLPRIREQVKHDLALRDLSKDKVLAVIVYLLERSHIRVGNGEYARRNKTFGLTTMLTHHAAIEGQKIEFDFLGKSKIQHRIEIHDRRLAKLIKKIQDLPGQELFHFVDHEKNVHSISSSDVNGYLRNITEGEFTAKDFRTWWGTLLALVELSNLPNPSSQTAAKRAVAQAMKAVSSQLGNTPSVCRKCYVHPKVIQAFENGELAKLSDVAADLEKSESVLQSWEHKLIQLLAI